MTRRACILLFDIDGTLIDAGGAGRRALSRAFAACCGRADACDGLRFSGMTDGLILEAALAAIKHADTPELRAALLERYVAELEAGLASARDYRVLPGVVGLLDALAQPGVALGLGTGNIERGARAKLARAGLNERFAFGGFGCDATARADVIAAGVRRGAARLALAPEQCEVTVIGDTPRDVAAARANGARALGVTTGGYDAAALRSAGADRVCADLTLPDLTPWLLARRGA